MTHTTTPQQHTGSGFGARSTTSDVLRGVDLGGRLAVVTGGYVGLGLETTRALVRAGARVVVPARRRDVAAEALDGLVGAEGPGGVEVDEMDLADLDSVRGFADRFLATGRSLDLLVHNAGVMAVPETRVGPAGWEGQLAVNHLGHYALANHLRPALVHEGGARVVALSSRGHHLSGIRWDDPHFRAEPYDKWVAYGQSKTANALFAVHLDALGRDSGVRAFSVHPGMILTELGRHVPREEQIAQGWIDEDGNLSGAFKTVEQGAATQVWAATAPALAGLGGVYCEDCDVAEPAAPGGEQELRPGVRDHATDPAQAARLWALSAELTGIDAFGAAPGRG
ncbi:SDR family NAD(P)-dependent oxidoreductase [Streptomyces sp. 184]|uniref:SDR family NAD(P)-dependent oxidoreductase n=1 Tax=Streptomyces sp. 184 TaxID=1827526 RepID=UPI003891D40F